MKSPLRLLSLLVVGCLIVSPALAGEFRLTTFAVDASPAVGSPLAYDPTKEVTWPLSCRGAVLLGADKPIVLCAVDWIGIGNDSNRLFRQKLADATGTTIDRVAVHTLHQHDAPRCDLGSAAILAKYNAEKLHYDVEFLHDVIDRAAVAAGKSLESTTPITSIAIGSAEVKEVASNRRMLDAEGKVAITRYTACKDPKIRDLPVGVIDPMLRLVTFYNGDKPVAVITAYATHPQSFYRTGGANPDFPGMARDMRQKETGIFHLHFNGAGGNVGAGKYNDGSHENRQVLADKVANAMNRAWESQEKTPITAADVAWKSVGVQLPAAPHLDGEALAKEVASDATPQALRVHAADKLSFYNSLKAGEKINIGCLSLGDTRVLFLPGELFVEYQLAAQHMRPDKNVLMAAYGDYGPFYIGTRVAYWQGGYETSERATNVSPEVEQVLTTAIATLLEVPDTKVRPNDFTDTIGPGLPK
ncbi:hypothetical protein LOC68_06715 [Blastopirellula sp. JC732]|uniref:Neutral/alkaline non-lysosomal ceramidase N-terminal domain-containing protein n=1 Tax=Blastopirellula sediminis TaxID=2894196 RepID=A0A9X1MK99_9BACT|nr:hypothetical protein [Blastopirellula sediminis]MCC9609142.1 hypothetical protein [Blastopirellula sediminis]MCC9628081.1 hypothetical protein [Blastopirellula sediminis]